MWEGGGTAGCGGGSAEGKPGKCGKKVTSLHRNVWGAQEWATGTRVSLRPLPAGAAALAPSPPAARCTRVGGAAEPQRRVASLRPREALCSLLRVSASHSPPGGNPCPPKPPWPPQNTAEPQGGRGAGPPRTPGFLERAHVTSPCAINGACCWAEFGEDGTPRGTPHTGGAETSRVFSFLEIWVFSPPTQGIFHICMCLPPQPSTPVPQAAEGGETPKKKPPPMGLRPPTRPPLQAAYF